MPLYFTKADVEAVLAETKRAAETSAYERGHKEGREESARFASIVAACNGHAGSLVKALKKEVEDGPVERRGDLASRSDRGSEAQSGVLETDNQGLRDETSGIRQDQAEAEGEATSPQDALILALCSALEEAKIHHPDSTGGEVVANLEALLDDPEALQEVLDGVGGETLTKAMRRDAIELAEDMLIEDQLLLKAKDYSGHEHKGKGKGGGQFTGGGSGGGGEAKDKLKADAKSNDNAVSQPDKMAVQAKSIVKKLKPSKQRAFTGVAEGEQIDSRLAGAIGEEILIQHLKSLGYADAGQTSEATGTTRNNLPFDLIHDHQLIEAKTGQANNPKGVWALKYDGRFTKEQESQIAKMSLEDAKKYKSEINRLKVAGIHKRKEDFVKSEHKRLGFKVKPGMMTVIINPTTKTADIYKFDGIHDRIPFNSDMANAGYVRSVKYG